MDDRRPGGAGRQSSVSDRGESYSARNGFDRERRRRDTMRGTRGSNRMNVPFRTEEENAYARRSGARGHERGRRPSDHAAIVPHLVGGYSIPPIPVIGLAVIALALLLVVVFAIRGCAGGGAPSESSTSSELSTSSEPVSSETPLEASSSAEPQQTVAMQVEELSQLPDYPSGCEPTSLTIVLRAFGYDVEISDILDNYVTYDETWTDASAFLGDPVSGGGCFPPCIVAVANDFLSDQGDTSLRAVDLTGSTFDEIIKTVENGSPVLLWTTMYEEDPAFSGQSIDGYDWYTNEHCIVVYGIEGDDVLVSDPLDGLVARDYDRLSELFEECGSMAVVIEGDVPEEQAGESSSSYTSESSSSSVVA